MPSFATIVGNQMQRIVTEKFTSCNARTRVAILEINKLVVQGKLNSPEMIRAQYEAELTRRWALIAQKWGG